METTKLTPHPKVMIGLPTMGSVHTFLMVRILTYCMSALQKGNISIGLYPTLGVSPVDNARNEIVSEFLRGDHTHLFWIDSDTIPPAEALEKLLALDTDIASAVTPIVEYDDARKNSDSNGFYRKMNCVDLTNNFVKENTGTVEIQGAGGSCVLVKRAVYEKMKGPWYRFRYEDDNGKECTVGEDISFVAFARSLGFKAYADTSIICGHQKPIIW